MSWVSNEEYRKKHTSDGSERYWVYSSSVSMVEMVEARPVSDTVFRLNGATPTVG